MKSIIEPAGFIQPDWPAADNIRAFSSTRNLPPQSMSQQHSSSQLQTDNGEAFNDFNLALHVEDSAQRVETNRHNLIEQLKLPAEPLWLNQVHGHRVVNAVQFSNTLLAADASFSAQPNHICTVMTADCLPLLFCNLKGNKVAAAHAGWRGLADGVIENTVASLNEAPHRILVWLGPAIGPRAFEVGEEVRDIFINEQATAVDAFQPNRDGHFLADIYKLARLRLTALGIEAVYGGGYCTYTDAQQFYSYRRNIKTGRQASLIWFE